MFGTGWDGVMGFNLIQCDRSRARRCLTMHPGRSSYLVSHFIPFSSHHITARSKQAGKQVSRDAVILQQYSLQYCPRAHRGISGYTLPPFPPTPIPTQPTAPYVQHDPKTSPSQPPIGKRSDRPGWLTYRQQRPARTAKVIPRRSRRPPATIPSHALHRSVQTTAQSAYTVISHPSAEVFKSRSALHTIVHPYPYKLVSCSSSSTLLTTSE